MKKYCTYLMYLLFCFAINAQAQSLRLFKDINTKQPSYTLGLGYVSTITYHNELYFVLREDNYGAELWKTDGTTNGTHMLKDIYPGNNDSGPNGFTILNDTLYFFASDREHGRELWRTDGTESNTLMVADLRAGLASFVAGSEMVAVNNLLFFVGYNGTSTGALYASDGTGPGTHLVFSAHPQALIGGSGIGYKWLFPYNNKLLFFSNDSTFGYELYISDGTSSGTHLVKDINPSTGSYIDHSSTNNPRFTQCNNAVYFFATDSVHGNEVWKTDGTDTGTYILKDINPGIFTSNPSNFTAYNNLLFFSSNDGIHGYEPWISDGTNSGTLLLKDIYPGSNLYGNYLNTALTYGATNILNGIFFFLANDSIHGFGLWKTDGTAAGTQLVNDILVDASSGNNLIMAGIHDSLLVFMQSDSTGYGIYSTQGDSANTTLVKHITQFFGNSNPGGALDFIGVLNDKFIFNERSFLPTSSWKTKQLWVSDGTIAGTDSIVISFKYNASSFPRSFTKYNNNKYLFTANDGIHGHEVWKTDGTVGGTSLVKDIYPVNDPDLTGYSPTFLGEVNNKVYFIESDSNNWGVWKSNGTKMGTRYMSSNFHSVGRSTQFINDKIFFSATDATHGLEPWIVDAASNSVHMLCDLYDYPQWGSNPEIEFVRNGYLYFTARKTDGQVVLYKTNGTACIQITDVDFNDFTMLGDTVFSLRSGKLIRSYPNHYSSFDIPTNCDSLKAILATDSTYFYFKGKDVSNKLGLWRSDGTTTGTTLVKNINPSGDAFPLPSAFYSYSSKGCFYNGKCYFFANDGVHGFELWSTDGTANGTQLLKDINPLGDSKPLGYSYWPINENGFINAAGKLYFVADDGVHGDELWVTDGTTAGTHLVKDINPNGSALNDLLNSQFMMVDSVPFFTAVENGIYKWYYIDPATGELEKFDINPGFSDGSYTLSLLPDLKIAATFSPKYGYELFSYSLKNNPDSGKTVYCYVNSSCTGDSLDVKYNVTSRVFANNKTLLQLSDANGSFASPTVLDTLPGSSGERMVHVPSSVTPGNGYRLRLATTHPPSLLADNGIDITLSSTPVISCVDSIIRNALPGQCSKPVHYNLNVAASPQGEVNYSIPSGSVFPVGETVVTMTAWNGCGYDTCYIRVIVHDAEAPVINCPADFTTADSAVIFNVTATDNCAIDTLLVSPPSGSVFAAGTTIVNAEATDVNGNTATCSFSVTVTTLRKEMENAPAFAFSVEPVPTHDFLNVSLNAQRSEPCNLSIRTLSGNVILVKQLRSEPGNNYFKLDAKNISPGIYLLELSSDSFVYNAKVIKL